MNLSNNALAKVVGFELMRKELGSSIPTQLRRYKSAFGVDWGIVGDLMTYMLEEEENEPKTTKKRRKYIKNILCTLFFFKQYSTEEQNAMFAKCTEKTFRSIAWKTIEKMAHLEGRMVRKKFKYHIISFFFVVV